MSLCNLSLELYMHIVDYLNSVDKVAFAQTGRFAAIPSQISLRKHLDITYQDTDQVYQLACLVKKSPEFVNGVMTLHINTTQFKDDISLIPFCDTKMVLQWIMALFPNPPDQKRTKEAMELAETGRLRWRLGFFQPDIKALLAFIMVSGTNLRQVSLQVAESENEPTFTQLVLSKIAYDSAIGVKTFPKMQHFSITPSRFDEVPVLPNLQHFALHYATETVSLRIQPLRSADPSTLETLAFHHVYAAAHKAQEVLSLTMFPLLRKLCISEWIWDNQLSYPRLISLIRARCESLETFVFDFVDKLDKDAPNGKQKPLLSTLQNITSTRIHIDHLPSNYQDLTVILAPGQPAWPANAKRLEITGLTVRMLYSVAAAYTAGLPIKVDPGCVQSLRLVFDSNELQNTPLDQEIQPFLDALDYMLFWSHIDIGVYLRRTSDQDAEDELYFGCETKPVFVEDE